ncbi:NAK protein kinase [Puccinia striiformis f. sp. tritici PST-78]|uniref:non-specific serine/threonine protein kinase n=1 Tax=Puccinia striiformis f. sp. tritici PST-78 TaxID=1165861 RepID=A0A0L0VF79_9BASI|nr:NAK protein kinase [Puccinia striiformis f. sp. tritici PST-78]
MSPVSSLNEVFQSLQDSLSSITSCFCQPDSTLKLNGRTLKIVKLLGEGGFSYVYLAQDPSSGRLFALKKIRCPLGSDSVNEAIKEVEAYKRFRHPNIIRCLDSCVVQDKDGDGKVVYLFLPYYAKGNLQDLVNLHTDLAPLPENDILKYFLGTAQALSAMHGYTPKKRIISDSYPPNGLVDPESPGAGLTTPTSSVTDRKGKRRQNMEEERLQEEREEEEEEEEGLGRTEDERQEAPLMGNIVSNHETNHHHPPATKAQRDSGSIEPWAHRDLKPANVLISDDDQPILMDFGSAIKARIPVPNRSIALQQQDLAAEHSSMPYRAPELFDVKTGEDLTEAVDIWSLGCVLYCLGYGHSPFETTDTVEQGGSMALAVMNGSWKFPNNSKTAPNSNSINPSSNNNNKSLRVYSDQFQELIKSMLVLDPKARPTIYDVIDSVQILLDQNQSRHPE